MNTFLKFLFEFLNQFYTGFITIGKSIFKGIGEILDFKSYISIINFYKEEFTAIEWIFVIIAMLIVLAIFASFIIIVIMLIKKYVRFRKTLVEQESLLEEVAILNNEVAKLMKEKQDILSMKVSQLGLKPGEEVEE